jgi:hypothetical protein
MRRREEREKSSEARERRVLGVYSVPVDYGGDTRIGGHMGSRLVLALPSVTAFFAEGLSKGLLYRVSSPVTKGVR